MLISEAPLLCHLFCATLRPHPRLIPHCGPAPRGPQKESYLAGCHPKETLHCCWVTLVVFSNACSDLAYTGHPLLCPLLTTVLAKLYNQTDWASSPDSRLPPCPSSILRCVLPQAWKEAGTLKLRSPQEHGRKGHIRHFCLLYNEDEDDNWWCYFGLRLLDCTQTVLTVIFILVLTRPGNCSTCSVGQVYRATPSKTHLKSGWSSAVWSQPSHWASSTLSTG